MKGREVMIGRLPETTVLCGHEECEQTYVALVQFTECLICGQFGYLAPGCFFSQQQATNPVRRGIGQCAVVALAGVPIGWIARMSLRGVAFNPLELQSQE